MTKRKSKIYIVREWCIPQSVLIALSAAALVEVLGLALNIPPMFSVGFVEVYWTLIPCLGALALVFQFPNRPDIVVNEPRVLAYIVLVVTLVVFGSLYTAHQSLGVTLAIFTSVGIEEVVYRLAIPALVMIVARRLGISKTPALIAGVLTGMALFGVMPGHLEQFNGALDIMSLVAFTLLMSHAVWRGNSLIAPIIAHAIYDYATLGMNSGAVSTQLRLVGASAALLALVVISSHPKVNVIDIRESPTRPAAKEPAWQ